MTTHRSDTAFGPKFLPNETIAAEVRMHTYLQKHWRGPRDSPQNFSFAQVGKHSKSDIYNDHKNSYQLYNWIRLINSPQQGLYAL